MVYNEIDFMPIWLRHYSSQVGAESCFIIDHGSDDGSVDNIGKANLIRLPRSPQDNKVRSDFISEFCSALLKYFDAVVYTDVDEMLVADPARFKSLPDLAARTTHDVTTAFGMNVVHCVGQEPPLDFAAPLLAQRGWAVPTSSMMKPLLIRRPVRWVAGFHTANAPYAFDGLFNFHLAHCDLDLGLRRQAKRRATAFAVERPEHHHRFGDEWVHRSMTSWRRKPMIEDVNLDADCPHYQSIVQQMLDAERIVNGKPQYRPEKPIGNTDLWRIPDRFQGAF